MKDDCNNRLISLAKYLRESSKRRKCLAFIDPFGLQLKWSSIEALKDLGVDLWILVSTSTLVRLIPNDNDRQIPAFIAKFSEFTGIPADEINSIFYKEKTELTLFGIQEQKNKVDNITENIINLYISKLKEIWKDTSRAYPMLNSRNSVMFHFLLASNNKTAIKIADDIIGKELTE